MKKKTKNYIEPEELKDCVREMHEKGQMTERFAKHLLTIQEHVLLFPRFVRYHEDVKDDMRLHNIERWVRTGWKYIKADGNPFSYITTGCYLNFLDALKTHFGKQNNEVAMLKHLLDIAVRENEAIGTDVQECVKEFIRQKEYVKDDYTDANEDTDDD